MSSNQPRANIQQYLQKIRSFSVNARIVLLYSAITGLAIGVFRFLFNFYILSLGGYDEAFIGDLQSWASLAALGMALPAAYFADRYSQKHIMIITGFLTGLSFLGLVLFPFRLPLILFRMVAGITMSTRQVAIAPFLMANTSEDERQWVFSFNFGLMATSNFLGNFIGGYLPTWLGGYFNAGPTDTLSYQLALGKHDADYHPSGWPSGFHQNETTFYQ